MRWIAPLCLLLLLLSGAVRADLAPPDSTANPKPAPPVAPQPVAAGATAKTELVAHIGNSALKLELPRKVLAQLQGFEAVPAKKGSGLAPFKTMLAGLALAIGLGYSGLWLTRRNPRVSQPVMVLCGIAVLGVSLSVASWADVPPDDRAFDRFTAPAEVKYIDAKLGTVTVEVVDEGSNVEVVLKGDDLKALLAAAKGEKK